MQMTEIKRAAYEKIHNELRGLWDNGDLIPDDGPVVDVSENLHRYEEFMEEFLENLERKAGL